MTYLFKKSYVFSSGSNSKKDTESLWNVTQIRPPSSWMDVMRYCNALCATSTKRPVAGSSRYRYKWLPAENKSLPCIGYREFWGHIQCACFSTYPAEYGQMAKTPPGSFSWSHTRFSGNLLFVFKRNNSSVPLSINAFDTRADMPDRNEWNGSLGCPRPTQRYL